jgi:carbon storage regulator
MLVLSRRRSERIVIGSEIRITVVKVDRNQVRLGIEAPQHVPVLRAELIRDGAPPDDTVPGRSFAGRGSNGEVVSGRAQPVRTR